MNTEDIRKIGIIGSGTMGRGIAICSALAGFETVINDISAEALTNSGSAIEKILSVSSEKKKITEEEKNAALSRIIYASDFNSLKDCDFIIEAAAEDELIKKDIFSRLDSICRSDAILSTNTSSLSVTNISAAVKNNPGRVIGMHFFNPANIMKLVEIVKGDFTSEDTLKTTTELTNKLNKTPVTAKDTPAFIVNRIARPFYGEALKILAEGTSDPETIDKVMKECGKFAMGPFELMDLIGIDVNFSVTKSVYEAFFNDPKYRPSFIQKKMTDANMLGRKTGRGFYNYNK
ncbi:MAG TPA: 3-hydroxyacyl-CoA dehydrogenase NAD-binding domain-containing protein [Ignavibacteria bacterium]|nr:3-hydroxybutyryl-CoA dehydrogenase [Bacteroidota bacterium]HRI86089.1 3-hydroxyacyl-CoA dehydrogenase NAD-binding domain-containing protein [Ignavibacteria bacterium]HRK00646.1 3-hydroxyacyl-CoA dehydrogenase NAD-binding domain-containing protein [Ignavibacteria bacterium]